MSERLKSIVDLEKYPIYDLNSPTIKNLIKRCKEELDQFSCSTIPNFILPNSLKIMNSELEKQLDEVYMSKESINPYLYAEDNQKLPKDHPKRTLGRAKTIINENSKNYFYMHSVVKDNLSKLAVVVSIKSKEKSDKIDLFGKQLSMHIAASNPISVTSEQISKEILIKEQDLISEELKNSGKPEDIAKKISVGKLNKFKEENSLMTQQWVMEPKKKVMDVLHELVIPDIKIVDFYRIKIGD